MQGIKSYCIVRINHNEATYCGGFFIGEIMATRISASDIGGSYLQSAGWKLIRDYVNSNIKLGIFAKNGKPFYDGLVEFDRNAGLIKPIKWGGQSINPLTGAEMADGEDDFKLPDYMGNNNRRLVEAGVSSLNYSTNSNITNAPIEGGAFISINKVLLPTQNNVNYVVTGTDKQREYFLRACEKARTSLQLFTVHCKDQSFLNMNIVGHSVSRDDKSSQMFFVNISLQEVMQKTKPIALDKQTTAFSGSGSERGELEAKDATSQQIQTASKRQ